MAQGYERFDKVAAVGVYLDIFGNMDDRPLTGDGQERRINKFLNKAIHHAWHYGSGIAARYVDDIDDMPLALCEVWEEEREEFTALTDLLWTVDNALPDWFVNKKRCYICDCTFSHRKFLQVSMCQRCIELSTSAVHFSRLNTNIRSLRVSRLAFCIMKEIYSIRARDAFYLAQPYDFGYHSAESDFDSDNEDLNPAV